MADVPIDPIGAARRLDTILGRTDLPYTYTDEDDVALRVDRGVCTAYDRPGRASVSFYAPKGEDAVRLAHAVLAAAGHTGHIVVSTEDSARAIRIRESVAAEDMRERAARVPAVIASSDPLAMRTVFEQIFALPLLDGDTDDRHPSLCGDAQSDLPPDQPATVHVATPEGITPCGEGHRDVTVTARIPEATCLTCLRTLAQAPQDDLTETSEVARLTSERDRYRTAWESARRGRTQARAQLADARRYVRILDEQRAAREVTTMAELADRVTALEDRLSPPTMKGVPAPQPAPARYRDREGDIWERTDPFLYVLVDGEATTGAIYSRPLEYVRDTYGPLTPVTDTTKPAEPAPCEECGRPYAEQEHGPDGKCRHTPATRLGRPTT